MTRILIVEDEPKLASLLADYLARDNFDTRVVHDGPAALAAFGSDSPDLILLDLNLPGMDGIEVCKRIRQQSQVPIIMTTARVDEVDRLIGLELGADDYVCKPYSPREVVARVKAVLRRISPATGTTPGLTLQEDQLRVSWQGRHLTLSAVEFALLAALVRHPGRIYSREQLMDIIYPDGRVVSDRTIDSHIKKIRRKLEGAFEGLDCIHSVYGAGYKYELP